MGACAAQKFGGKSVLFFAVCLWSLSTVVTPMFSDSALALIICRIALGLGEGLGKFGFQFSFTFHVLTRID